MLHVDDFLTLMLGDGVPDRHVVGRQVQLVGAGQSVVAGKRICEAGTGSSISWKMARCTVHRSGCGMASISCQEEPGKRTGRSLMYSPRLSELLAGERGCVIAWAGVGLNARHGDASPDLAAQPPQLGLQRIQFGTGNADQFGCFGAHAAPSVRRFRPSVDRQARISSSQIVRRAIAVPKSGPLRWVTAMDIACRRPWTGSWTGASDNLSVAKAVGAITVSSVQLACVVQEAVAPFGPSVSLLTPL